PVADPRRQARPVATQPLDAGLGGAGRARTAADAAAEPAGQRGTPAADALGPAGPGPDAGGPDRGADERGPPGRRGRLRAAAGDRGGNGPAEPAALTGRGRFRLTRSMGTPLRVGR